MRRRVLAEWLERALARRDATMRRERAVHFARERALRLFLARWRCFAAATAARRAERQCALQAACDCIAQGRERRALHAWHAWYRRRGDIKVKWARACALADRFSVHTAFRAWREYHSLKCRARLLAQNAAKLRAWALARQAVGRWRAAATARREARSQRNLALMHWALSLKLTCMTAWVEARQATVRKRRREKEAHEMFRMRLLRKTAAQWVNAALDMERERTQAALERESERTRRVYLTVRRCASKWLARARSRIAARGQHMLSDVVLAPAPCVSPGFDARLLEATPAACLPAYAPLADPIPMLVPMPKPPAVTQHPLPDTAAAGVVVRPAPRRPAFLQDLGAPRGSALPAVPLSDLLAPIFSSPSPVTTYSPVQASPPQAASSAPPPPEHPMHNKHEHAAAVERIQSRLLELLTMQRRWNEDEQRLASLESAGGEAAEATALRARVTDARHRREALVREAQRLKLLITQLRRKRLHV
eukprot:TRINITY_DN1662_c0_g2_i1.p1 TRINITY_DN1662_c0_g2~~TRINITY_DN1662_c0_g2_i1.p1  ORF type:complete len:480 (+),score=91.44 TRINITY_DN1662_c0_g2_i1:131-1570(+)